MNKLKMSEQVEKVLTDALRCSDVGTTDLEQVSPPLDAVRPAAEQTLYRLMGNRLGTLWLRNPGSEGIADHSTECLMPQDMIQVRGIHRAIWGLKTTRAPEMEKQ